MRADPLQAADGAFAGTRTATVPSDGDPTTRPLVLVVDDCDDTCESLAAVVALAGYRVLTASNGADALRIARSALPDLMLMDVFMPGLDGWTATALLRGDPATAHIIIVMMSGFAAAAMIPVTRQPAWDGYLTKPVSNLRLQRELEERLGGRA